MWALRTDAMLLLCYFSHCPFLFFLEFYFRFEIHLSIFTNRIWKRSNFGPKISNGKDWFFSIKPIKMNMKILCAVCLFYFIFFYQCRSSLKRTLRHENDTRKSDMLQCEQNIFIKQWQYKMSMLMSMMLSIVVIITSFAVGSEIKMN